MKFIFLPLLFAFSAHAAEFSGSFTAKEVDPIIESRYVSDWCHRSYECRCGMDQDGHATPCDTCTETYACGEYKEVQIGSRPLYDLVVNYAIQTAEIGASTAVKIVMGSGEINKGFSPKSLFDRFIHVEINGTRIYAKSVEVSEEIKNANQKVIRLSASLK